jgi:hypothetical protein
MSSNHHSRPCSVYTAISTLATSHDTEFRTMVRKAVSSRASLLPVDHDERSAPFPSQSLSQDRHPGSSHAGPYLTYSAKVINNPAHSRSGRRPNQWLWLVESFAMSWGTAKGLDIPLGVGCFCDVGNAAATATGQPYEMLQCRLYLAHTCANVLYCNYGATWGGGTQTWGAMQDGQSPSCPLVAVFAPSSQASRFPRVSSQPRDQSSSEHERGAGWRRICAYSAMSGFGEPAFSFSSSLWR